MGLQMSCPRIVQSLVALFCLNLYPLDPVIFLWSISIELFPQEYACNSFFQSHSLDNLI